MAGKSKRKFLLPDLNAPLFLFLPRRRMTLLTVLWKWGPWASCKKPVNAETLVDLINAASKE